MLGSMWEGPNNVHGMDQRRCLSSSEAWTWPWKRTRGDGKSYSGLGKEMKRGTDSGENLWVWGAAKMYCRIVIWSKMSLEQLAKIYLSWENFILKSVRATKNLKQGSNVKFLFQKKIYRHKILEKELEWGRLEQGEKEETINFSFSQTECVGLLMGVLFKYHALAIHFSHTII